MKLFLFIRTLRHKWNALVIRRLRKVGIFKRLNISFLVLLLTSAFFLTFFSFFQYSREISLNLDPIYHYVSTECRSENPGHHERLRKYCSEFL